MNFLSKALFTGVFALAFLGAPKSAQAQQTNHPLNGTVVLRVDTRDNSMAMVATPAPIANEDDAKALADSKNFKNVPAGASRSELDRDGGTSSWYFYRPRYYGYNYPVYGGYYGGYYNYNYPAYYYYGNTYAPYYYYGYGNYQYYYYGRGFRGGRGYGGRGWRR